ncbi:MAG: M28 family peptidase [Gemmatimonadota bacterium]|nr:M28 family peptidase [Gemmatimonadota bacterium]
MRAFVLGGAAAALVTLSALPSAAPAQRSPSAAIATQVRARFDGQQAFATVAFLDQFARWPGARGFDASIDHIAAQLEQAGYVRQDKAAPNDRLTYRIERYPMNVPAWEAVNAEMRIDGAASPVLQYATNRNMLANNSYATPAGGVVAEVVDLGTYTPAALDAVDVKGKIVLADGRASQLFSDAVGKHGAVGVLAYSLPAYSQPEKHRTSIMFQSIPLDTVHRGWGINLSYAARAELRAALARGPVTLRVTTDVAWTQSAVERTVVADVRGSAAPDERFVFSAHVQEPGANDNASGVGAQMEMARVTAQLLRAGSIDPRRSITFLWGLEIRSTDRYITQDSVRARGIKWGLSLDMVGEDTRKTGGTFLIEKMPDPSSVWTRGEDRHTEWGGRPLDKSAIVPHYFNDFVLQRCLEQAATNGWVVKTNPFEGGSDHTPFLKAKMPGLLFWHFTDQFYHTDGDRMDKVSADELKNVGVSALVSALVLSSADGGAARGVVAEVTRAALARLTVETSLSTQSVKAGGEVLKERDILQTWGAYFVDALRATAEIEVGGATASTRAAIDQAVLTVQAATREALSRLP